MDKEQAMFIRRLTELLEEFNMTQIELANKIGITNVTISRYLSGERKPRIEIITKIANAFSVTTDYLLGNSDIKEPPTDEPLVAFEGGLEGLTEEQKKIIMDLVENMKNSNK